MTYWKFCRELKITVCGCWASATAPMTICFRSCGTVWTNTIRFPVWKITTKVFKAVAFFTYKYGKIDWLESNNEYWLMRDAAPAHRIQHHHRPQAGRDGQIRFKSCMKEYYAKAGIPTARYHLVEGLEDALEFAHTVGYPVVVKPDNGVGACNTYKLQIRRGRPVVHQQ